MQRPEYFARWAAEVPADFVFAVKAPRYITHIRRLRDVETPLASFLAYNDIKVEAPRDAASLIARVERRLAPPRKRR